MNNPKPFHCPKCGSESLRRLSAKKFECQREACGFTVYRNVAGATAAIIECGDKILVIRRAKEPDRGKLDLPGGFVDEGETLEECVSREVYEELHLRLHDISYLCSFPNDYTYKGIRYPTIDSVFLSKGDVEEIECDEGEIEEYELVDPRQLNLEDFAFESLRNGLKYYLRLKDLGEEPSPRPPPDLG